MGGGQSDGAGSFNLQTVKVSIAVPIELAYEGGVQLSLVEAHIINLPVKVAGAAGSVPPDYQVVTGRCIDGVGVASIGGSAIDVEFGIPTVSIRTQGGYEVVPVAIGQSGGRAGNGIAGTSEVEYRRSRRIER